MDYTYSYDHDEDYLPSFQPPISILSRRIGNGNGYQENTAVNPQPNPFLDNWKSLYEKSAQYVEHGNDGYTPYQQPSSYVRQQPSSYVRQQPSSYAHQQPSSYAHQQPSSYVHQKPSSYVHQQSSSCAHQQPSSYAHQQPSPYAHQQPSPYAHQQPSSCAHQQPSSYAHQPPSSYAHQPPSSYAHQQPSSYLHQQPSSYVHEQPSSYVRQQPSSYVHEQPSSYVRQQPSVEKPAYNIVHPSASEPVSDSTAKKSKWEIRLPELLSTTVGPDRQNYRSSRRHTANIVFLQPSSNNNESDINPVQQTPSDTYDDRPNTPIVRQMKEKFDQMSLHNRSNTYDDDRMERPLNSPTRLPRMASITSRVTDVGMNERSIPTPRSILPVRPMDDRKDLRSHSFGSGSSGNHIPASADYAQRTKGNRPISYPKHAYPRPSASSLVKRLLNEGATRIYESTEELRSPYQSQEFKPQQTDIRKAGENLKRTNSLLSGRQRQTDSPDNSYNGFKNRSPDTHEPIKSKIDQLNGDNFNHFSRRESNSSSNSPETPRSEIRQNISNKTRNMNENLGDDYYEYFDNEDD